MTFADLPAGASIFLDANPLVYHFAPDPKFAAACIQLLARIVNQEIQAYTSTHVLSEVAHQLMLLEAANVFGWSTKITSRLKQQPTQI
jgi:predicted nucleic acid-binding protein